MCIRDRPDGAEAVVTAGKETYYKLGDEYYTDEECTKMVTAAVKLSLIHI